MAVPPTIRAPFSTLLEIVDVGDLGIVLFFQNFRKALGIGDPVKLTLNAIEEAGVLQIRQFAFRFGAANAEIELQLDGVSGNLQVFEACAQERNLGNMVVDQRVLGGNLGHQAIGRDYITYVESLEHRRRLSYPARVIVTEDVLLVLELAADQAGVARRE